MKFLVIRLSSMGDVILTTPFLRALRRRFPEAEVHFLTKALYAGLIASHPAVDRVLRFDESAPLLETGRRLRGERYDAVFDLHKNLRSIPLARMARPGRVLRIHKATLRRWLLIVFKLDLLKNRGDQPAVCIEVGARLGLTDDGDPPDVHPPGESLHIADTPLAEITPPLWGLIPVASSWNKSWPHFAELGSRLTKRFGGTCLLFGGPDDAGLCDSIAAEIGPGAVSFAGRRELTDTAALLQRCAAVVGNDTGLTHLATAVGTPTVALFGPTTRQLGYFPRGAHVRVLEREMDCRPCTKNGLERCPRRRDLACLAEIIVENVMEACWTLIGA
ncbi:MAG TPA: glycosyltransferase family 9 protein [bacterium]|nr:glycosyltransferase family 9 protein [bacterium]